MAYRTKDQDTSVIDVQGTETQRLKNQATLQLLQVWRTGDAQEQAETWIVIKKALEEDRLDALGRCLLVRDPEAGPSNG